MCGAPGQHCRSDFIPADHAARVRGRERRGRARARRRLAPGGPSHPRQRRERLVRHRVHEPLDVLKVRLQVLDPAGPSGASPPGPARRPPRRARAQGNGRSFLTARAPRGPLALWKGSHRAWRAPRATGASASASTSPSPTPSTLSAGQVPASVPVPRRDPTPTRAGPPPLACTAPGARGRRPRETKKRPAMRPRRRANRT